MQYELFNVFYYDKNFALFKSLIKTIPLKWEVEELKKLDNKWLSIMCIKFKMPSSGTKEQKIARLIHFKNLAILIANNFDENYKLKSKTSTIREIKEVLKPLGIKHSWLRKTEKLELAKNKFIECWKFKPDWQKIV